jgi:hypothetical protein
MNIHMKAGRGESHLYQGLNLTLYLDLETGFGHM